MLLQLSNGLGDGGGERFEGCGPRNRGMGREKRKRERDMLEWGSGMGMGMGRGHPCMGLGYGALSQVICTLIFLKSSNVLRKREREREKKEMILRV